MFSTRQNRRYQAAEHPGFSGHLQGSARVMQRLAVLMLSAVFAMSFAPPAAFASAPAQNADEEKSERKDVRQRAQDWDSARERRAYEVAKPRSGRGEVRRQGGGPSGGSVPWYKQGLDSGQRSRLRSSLEAPSVVQAKRPTRQRVPQAQQGAADTQQRSPLAPARAQQQVRRTTARPHSERMSGQCPFGRCTGDPTMNYAPLLTTPQAHPAYSGSPRD